jgi:hypothetical protein
MTGANAIWEKRSTESWMAIDDYAADEFVVRVDGLAAALPPEARSASLSAELPGTTVRASATTALDLTRLERVS